MTAETNRNNQSGEVLTDRNNQFGVATTNRGSSQSVVSGLWNNPESPWDEETDKPWQTL
jgi:hypothetical protein